MPLNIPNMTAISNVGSQFKQNIFKGAAGKLNAQTKKNVVAQGKAKAAQRAADATKMPAQPTPTMSPAPPGTGPLGPDAMAQGRTRRQARAQGQPVPGPRTSQASGKVPFAGPRRAQSSGNGPSFGPAVPPKPTTAPTVGQVPTQFSSAQTPGTPRPANMFASSATHATPTFSHNASPAVSTAPTVKPSTNPFQVNHISNPSTTAAPKVAPSSLQFSDTSTKDNSPFPTHVHPAGSSSAILPSLSANETAKTGRPNEFTVGSRKPGSNTQGLGAMGSKLEEGLMNRPIGLPEQKRRI